MAPPTASKAAKAKKTAKELTKGSHKKAVKTRYTTKFYRPKTLVKNRSPKVLKRSVPSMTKMDKFRVIKYPLNTESAMRKIENNNTLVFIVDILANKKQIKKALEDLHDIKAVKVNTLIRPDGTKKAYVRISKEKDVVEVANKIGMM